MLAVLPLWLMVLGTGVWGQCPLPAQLNFVFALSPFSKHLTPSMVTLFAYGSESAGELTNSERDLSEHLLGSDL